jgi:hypothetical protein
MLSGMSGVGSGRGCVLAPPRMTAGSGITISQLKTILQVCFLPTDAVLAIVGKLDDSLAGRHSLGQDDPVSNNLAL